jgi:hypothetical protein
MDTLAGNSRTQELSQIKKPNSAQKISVNLFHEQSKYIKHHNSDKVCHNEKGKFILLLHTLIIHFPEIQCALTFPPSTSSCPELSFYTLFSEPSDIQNW